ncbi:MAG: hypothetical protein DMG65_06625 [Candidatus Angelobacter sp. Gp1-AA117]|nr:MAG: hypothetical protein DMG65_06625 [Candidatus Angelobacter sp. Gp1-AA117]
MGNRIVVVRLMFLIMALMPWTAIQGCAEERKIMDSTTAYKLVSDWGRAEREDSSGIQRQPNGSFYGKVANLGFEFQGPTGNLIVRGRIMPDAASLLKYKDIMQELDRIAVQQPERVSGARFELVHMPWDRSDQPTLYLRKDYHSATEGEVKIFDQWRKLRETAYLWHRTYYGEAVDPIVQRRLQSK